MLENERIGTLRQTLFVAGLSLSVWGILLMLGFVAAASRRTLDIDWTGIGLRGIVVVIAGVHVLPGLAFVLLARRLARGSAAAGYAGMALATADACAAVAAWLAFFFDARALDVLPVPPFCWLVGAALVVAIPIIVRCYNSLPELAQLRRARRARRGATVAPAAPPPPVRTPPRPTLGGRRGGGGD